MAMKRKKFFFPTSVVVTIYTAREDGRVPLLMSERSHLEKLFSSCGWNMKNTEASVSEEYFYEYGPLVNNSLRREPRNENTGGGPRNDGMGLPKKI